MHIFIMYYVLCRYIQHSSMGAFPGFFLFYKWYRSAQSITNGESNIPGTDETKYARMAEVKFKELTAFKKIHLLYF